MLIVFRFKHAVFCTILLPYLLINTWVQNLLAEEEELDNGQWQCG